MTDYSAMTDQEINNQIAKIKLKNFTLHNGDIYFIRNDGWNQMFDPCNNPSDAWPLIVENKINIEWGDNVMPDLFGWVSANALSDSHELISYSVDTEVHSPLRAACIVYLMMRNKDNE